MGFYIICISKTEWNFDMMEKEFEIEGCSLSDAQSHVETCFFRETVNMMWCPVLFTFYPL